jgi:hypothetical protein
MNLIRKIIKEGQMGQNLGFNIKNFPKFNTLIGGLRKKAYIVVGAGEKIGKTTFVDNLFICGVILDLYEKFGNWDEVSKRIKYLYFSLEVPKEDKMCELISYILVSKYDISLDADVISGSKFDENNCQVLIPQEIKQVIEDIINEYVIPIYGDYSEDGVKITDGIIDIYDTSINPTGINNLIYTLSEKYGKLHKKEGANGKMYNTHYENTTGVHLVVVLDHIRAVKEENGQHDKKKLADLTSTYFRRIMNLFKWTMIAVVHTNRSSVDNETLKKLGTEFHVTSDMIKDTSNLAEDCTCLITICDPFDPKYGLSVSFGLERRKAGEINRLVSIVSSRKSKKKLDNFFIFKDKKFAEC